APSRRAAGVLQPDIRNLEPSGGSMCGRITQYLSSEEIAELFGAEPLVNLPGGRFNVAPTQMVMVVLEDGERRVVTAHRWGLIPPWAESAQIGSRLINARGETVAEKPS